MLKHTSRGSHTSSSVWAGCCALALGAWLAAACAGHSQTVGGPGDGTSGSDGASTGRAGASNAGASNNGGAISGGASNGGASSGGASSGGAGDAGAPGMPDAGASGAPDNCATVDCADIVCPLNTALMTVSGNCCPTCVSTCKPACTIPCPVDLHPVMHAGQCCPSCEPDLPPPTQSCDSGKMSYAGFRAQLLEKYSNGCTTDQDCAAVAPNNRCESGCGYAALTTQAIENFNSNLSSAANTDCVNCPPVAIPKCVPPMPAVCVKNVCQLAAP